MKRPIRLLTVALMALVGAATAMGAVRTDRLITDGWTFCPGYDVRKTPETQTVSVPHSWNLTDVFSGLRYERNTFVYEHAIHRDAAMRGRRVFLKFDAVNAVADVAVNQQTVGHHAGGYTAFSMEITQALNDGQNKLTVMVSNAYRTDVAPLSGDFNIYGGITRPVHLITTGPDCISPLDHASSGVYVHQDRVSAEAADLTVETVLSLTTGTAGKQLRVALLDSDGTVAASAEGPVTGENMRQPLHISHPRLWNGRQDPYQYTVRVELISCGEVVDRVEEQTGLRWFSVDADRGFFLNGRHLDLHGVCRHEEGYRTGGLLNEQAIEEDGQIIEEMGATGVRFVHYPHSRQDVWQYDKRGIVLWYELNLAGPGGYLMPGYVKNADLEANVMQNLEEMIKQNYNSPAICIWSLCNELSFKYDEPATFLRHLNARAKELDRQRLTTLAICYDQDKFQHITDLIGWNKYFGWYVSKGGIGEFMDEAKALSAPQPIGLCEYGAAASPFKHAFGRRSTNRLHYEEDQTRVHEDNWIQLRNRPFVWCKFVWQYSDNPSSIRDEGDEKGMNDKGIVTYDRKIRKDAYYFYQANWSSVPMIRIASRRYTDRTEAVTDVKVFTNQPSAALYLNGKRVARGRRDEIGRIVFKGVKLQEGDNKVMVRAGRLTDSCTWNLRSGAKKEDSQEQRQGLDGAV